MHTPVLQKEVIKYLDPKPNENFIDATLGFGGHSKAILEKIKPMGKVLGIEIDKQVCQAVAEQGIGKEVEWGRLVIENSSYINLKDITAKHKFKPQGILFDLGMSSWDIERSGRGFTFNKNEPLDMRYGQNGQTANEIINSWTEQDIADLLWEYGGERFSRRIAKNIVEARKKQRIRTTFELVEIINKSAPRGKTGRRGIHPATKTFQALRIAVNNELENVGQGISQAVEVLGRGGRIVVVSFHSAEDRIVKNFFKNEAKNGLLQILTKKPITASPEELKQNPRSRSAKLRAAEIV